MYKFIHNGIFQKKIKQTLIKIRLNSKIKCNQLYFTEKCTSNNHILEKFSVKKKISFKLCALSYKNTVLSFNMNKKVNISDLTH